MYNFSITKERKEKILNNVIFSNSEKMIFELLTSGVPRKLIPNILKVSLRTVGYRIQNITKKIEDWELNRQSTIHYVYTHIFPNNKKYVGVCQNINQRWGTNGTGYKENKRMYNDILKYGWDNIQHIILLKTNDSYSAYNLENKLIKIFSLTDDDKGYNKK